MQINRLLEMVYILLDKKMVTAKELAVYFEVSQRTIYRDIDVLSAAGIPIYTNKGKGGGIRLLDNYVMNKSILSEKEQIDILSSLQGLSALSAPDVSPVLKKLAVLFDKHNTNWIDVDFSHWGSHPREQEKFNLLKTAILDKKTVGFDYFSSYGKKSERIIEPLKILFKGQSWYIYGFCRSKSDFRMFKVTRIKNLVRYEETFERDMPANIWDNFRSYDGKIVKLTLKIEARMAYRVYDEFNQECITKNEDGSFTVIVGFPESEWVYGYIMSYGDAAEVLEPKDIRETVKKMFQEGLKNYL
jgi:predicted DNA-binding transcriptional regulator YafY